MSPDKISVVSAGKIAQDISILLTTQGLRPCVVDTIEMSWEILPADTTDILSGDTTNALSADVCAEGQAAGSLGLLKDLG